LTPKRVEKYCAWRHAHALKLVDRETQKFRIVEQAISDGTIIRELSGVLRPALKKAMDQHRRKKGQYFVPAPSAPPGRNYWMTRSETAGLVRQMCRSPRARLHLPLYTLIGVYTGARRGAILDLTWPQIDFPAAALILIRQRRPDLDAPQRGVPMCGSAGSLGTRRAHHRVLCAPLARFYGRGAGGDGKPGNPVMFARGNSSKTRGRLLPQVRWQENRSVPDWCLWAFPAVP
jgi:integrase